ncbi:hypothetical protein U1Q18_034835 [Sarracenia purpurea var. burkii]
MESENQNLSISFRRSDDYSRRHERSLGCYPVLDDPVVRPLDEGDLKKTKEKAARIKTRSRKNQSPKRHRNTHGSRNLCTAGARSSTKHFSPYGSQDIIPFGGIVIPDRSLPSCERTPSDWLFRFAERRA